MLYPGTDPGGGRIVTADPHFRLVQEMTDAVGIDRRRIDPEEMSDLVHRCRDCTQVGACHSFLASLTPEPRRAPGYCVNRTRLDRLREDGIAEALSS
jgi:hypothetical protein